MSDARGGGKYQKPPIDAVASRLVPESASTRLHRALASNFTRLGIPVAGAGGLGWITADAHQMNTATAAASALVFGATVVASLTVRLVERYLEARPKIIEAHAKANEVKIKGEEVTASLEMQRTLLDKFVVADSAKAPHIERLLMRLMRQRLAAQALELGASPEQIRALGTLLVDDQAGQRSELSDEGAKLRALGLR